MFGYCNLIKLTEEQEAKLRAIDRKLDKSGHTPNRFLGTDANGNIVPRFAPSGDGTGLTPEQEQKLSKVDQKLDKTELPKAINQALMQARNSGLFDGQDGVTPNLTIGTVTTLEPGQTATAEITGTAENLKLNLGIPRGMDGGSGSGGISQAQLQQAVNQALTEAKNSGQFDGPAGADGGYYTPQVSQPDADHLEFGFSASTQGMAPVNSVQITLPKASGSGSGSEISSPAKLFSIVTDGETAVYTQNVTWEEGKRYYLWAGSAKAVNDPNGPKTINLRAGEIANQFSKEGFTMEFTTEKSSYTTHEYAMEFSILSGKMFLNSLMQQTGGPGKLSGSYIGKSFKNKATLCDYSGSPIVKGLTFELWRL